MSGMSKHTLMRDLMTPTPYTIGSEQKLSLAHQKMSAHHLRHLPVLRAGKLVGILTQRDLYFLQSMAGVDVNLDVIADAMTPDVYTTTPDATLRDVAHDMAKHKYGCAVVMDHGEVIGIFTITDALRHLSDVA
jgi:acetoin utilization protein AcuB